MFYKRRSISVCVLAQKLKGKYCDSYNPTYPCQEFSHLLVLARPSTEKPLVVVIDEVDRLILDTISSLKYGNQE